MPSYKSVFSSQLFVNTMFLEMYGGHCFEENLLLKMWLIITWTTFSVWVWEVNDTVTDLYCELLQLVYMVERSLPGLPAAYNMASNFSEEWRFHINWNVVSLVKQKQTDWRNYKRATLIIPNQAFIKSKKRWSCR